MKVRHVSWLLGLLLHGCAKYHTVSDVNDLQGAARVVVIEVRPRKDLIRQLAPGSPVELDLVLDDTLVLDEGMPFIHAHSGHTVSSGLWSRGGVVSVGVEAEAMYVLGVRTASTSRLWNTTALVPMLALIPEARGRCEYIGTFHVWPEAGGVNFEVRDELAANRAALESRVKGCRLLPNLARKLTPEDFGPVRAAAREAE